MKLIYLGPYGGVSVPIGFGGDVVCKPGDEVDIPDEVANKLLSQNPESWEVVGAKKKSI